mmetsp:Transcript_13635/g.39818  ORF Transcript_13635/g.39818 Transcript_13635/m.39818 type:complete len:288 (-) Transcript_13635:2324-3187(-)
MSAIAVAPLRQASTLVRPGAVKAAITIPSSSCTSGSLLGTMLPRGPPSQVSLGNRRAPMLLSRPLGAGVKRNAIGNTVLSSRNNSTAPGGRLAGRSNRRRKSTAAPFAVEGAPPLHRRQHPRENTLRDLFIAFREGLHEILLRPRTITVPRWITPKRFTVTYSECFGHASFILVAASYATDDFLTLRCVAVVGSASMLLFTYFHPNGRVLWLPFKWNMLFIAINSYRIGRVVFQSYWAEFMSDELKRIHAEHFFGMDRIDFAKLVKMGIQETYEPGDLIVAQNEPNR